MSWSGVRKRLCDGEEWMALGGGGRDNTEEYEEEEEQEEDEEVKLEEDETFNIFDGSLCSSHPEAVRLNRALERVSR